MAGIRPRTRHRLIALAIALTVPLLGLAAPAEAKHKECRYDPERGALICPGHSGGGDTSPRPPITQPRYYYTAWQFLGPCSWVEEWLHFRRYKIYTDGTTPSELEDVCIIPDEGGETAWAAVADAVADLTDPAWTANPDGVTASGLTGLETWVWYENPTQVGPIGVTWTDPILGITSAVEGRGWVGTLTWTVNDGEYEAHAGSFAAATDMGGTEGEPAATHLFDTTSAAAGHPDGYPVTVTLEWVGESRIRPPGAAWFTWTPIANTLTETAEDAYRVVEVRSALSG